MSVRHRRTRPAAAAYTGSVMRRFTAILLSFSLSPLWGWGDEGHRIVARIAAAHLTGPARKAVADLLRRDPDLGPESPSGQAADLMARAAIWPDHMPGGKGPTGPWHYIDIGLFEGPANMAARCPLGNCIVAKMTQYLSNLREHQADGSWPEFKELEFLLHFAGDIHQPLHCATDADAGGNCVKVAGFEPLNNLHAVWDIVFVRKLVSHDGPDLVSDMESRYRSKLRAWQDYGTAEKIAAESFRLARSQVYAKSLPHIPIVGTFFDVQPRNCSTGAPASIRSVIVDGPRSYGNASLELVRSQLYRAGVRLAAMLNRIYEP